MTRWRAPAPRRGLALSTGSPRATIHAGETLRRNLHDWLVEMALEPAGAAGSIDRYIGYDRPYATSHGDLDGDGAMFAEVRNAMRVLVERIAQLRTGLRPTGQDLEQPRPK